MRLRNSFDVLSHVVEQFETRGRSVRELEVTTDPDRAGALDVTMTVPVSLCAASSGTLDSSLTPEQASISERGGLTVTFSTSELLPDPPTDAAVVDVDERAVRVDDGELVLTVGFSVEPTGSETTDDADAEAEPRRDATDDETGEAAEADGDGDEDSLAARLAAARSEDVPAYDDIDYLRTLYESCDTFTEMSEHIEMDVAAETVRRYMIEADVHDPASYDTAAESDPGDDAEAVTDDSGPAADTEPSPAAPEPAADEPLVTDGIGLPEGVTVEDIVDAVVDATAVYEVQRSLDLDHGQTRDLLRQLNVLDLVLHRIDGPQRDASKTDVVQRIRQCAAGNA
ncbi:hypothetical protein [Haloarcula litorea]|uniref:hypothetical protein n=1 Tax=Haloarcula litorea TaxID=3032579 RepID=UPI0023E78FAA|nr:hypothetical protein [Halomicroarcula sp. GDY20]